MVRGINPSLWASISSYINEVFSKTVISSIAIEGTSTKIARRIAFAKLGFTPLNMNEILLPFKFNISISISLNASKWRN